MGHALVRHQHVVDDVGQALEVAQHHLEHVIGIAGQRIGLLDVVDAVDQLAKPLGVVGRVGRQRDVDEGDQAEAERLAGEALGFGLIAFIHITLATHSPDNAKRFRELVNRVDDIQEAYALTGDADYVLKVMLRDLKSLSDIVNNVLMPHQSVAHVRSSIVLDRLKESTKLPLKILQG